MNRLIFLYLFLFLSFGCSSSLEKPSGNTDFGQRPSNFEQAVKEYFYPKLKDGESARYIFSEPIKAYRNDGALFGGEISWSGWLVDVQINSKNGFGGYTGFKKYIVIFENGYIKEYYEGDDPVLLKRLP